MRSSTTAATRPLPSVSAPNLLPVDDRSEFVEPPVTRTRNARGAITGVLLGAGLWCGILALFGVIKF